MELGSRVTVAGGKSGVVRYIGTPEFAQGEWVGVELDGPDGKNDGQVNGVRYFTCEPLYGLFAKKSQVRLARISLGYGAANPLTTPPPAAPSSTSRLPQFKRTSSAASNIVPPSSSTTTSTTKSSIPRVESSPKLASSSVLRKSGAPTTPRTSISSTSGVLSPKAVPAPIDTELSGELDRAKAKIESLEADIEAKEARIQELEATAAEAVAEAEAAKKSAEEAVAASANETEETSQEDEESTAEPAPVPPTSPREEYEAKLRSIRDEGIALAAKMRHDMEITKTRMEKQFEDKEAQMTEQIEKLESQLHALETECVALRARNTELIASEQSRAEEIAQWQVKVGTATRKTESAMAQVVELQDTVELLTLEKETLQMDKEIADERIEELEAQLEAANVNQTVAWTSQDVSTDVHEENTKLRLAVKAMHDRHATEKADMSKKLKDLTRETQELGRYRDEVETTTTKYAAAQASIEELKEMLDMASAYESMVEALTEKNLSLGDQVADLKATVASLESLKEMSDEMEHQADLLAKELQNELAVSKQKVNELQAAQAVAATALQDKDRTIQRFRDVVQRNRDEMSALREKLRMEAGELEAMKDSTQSIMSQSLQLRHALQAARASGLDAARFKLQAQEMRLEHAWWQQLVPTSILVDTDRRQIQIRKGLLRLRTKSQWLLDAMSSPLLQPSADAPSPEGSKPATRPVEAALASPLLNFRRMVHLTARQVDELTSDTKWQDFVSFLDSLGLSQVENLLDAVLSEWSRDGQLSLGTDSQPSASDRLTRAMTEWMRAVASKLETGSRTTTVSTVKLQLYALVYQLGLQCQVYQDAHELQQVIWQLHTRVNVEIGDLTVLEDEESTAVASSSHALVEQLQVLVAYSQNVTSIAPFLERVKAWSKLVAKGAVTDILAPREDNETQDDADKAAKIVPLYELRAEQIRSELAQAANLMLAVEETTEMCHKLQARVKEMEKHESHSRIVIAKHEQEIARLEEAGRDHGAAVQKLHDQLETERQQFDQLLTEQHKERATLEATNRTLRKQLRRSSDMNAKQLQSPTVVREVEEDVVAKQALVELQRQLQSLRTELALARLPTLPPSKAAVTSPTSPALSTCVQQVAALASRVVATSALPELVDLNRHDRGQQDAALVKLVNDCNDVRDRVAETLQVEKWSDQVQDAVRAHEVWFTGRSCDPRPQDHTLPLRPMGRLIFPQAGDNKNGKVVPVVLNAAEMHLLTRSLA
ncbi:hypothetical protein LEN26_020214 [Aphanomyces euteiches]|nr:hypothetical protein LEN26_020214 [Aphanomyces euteiches]KAH9116833.1 hypothetical protein AeMF1_009290 [Aphanomyces euteiches]